MRPKLIYAAVSLTMAVLLYTTVPLKPQREETPVLPQQPSAPPFTETVSAKAAVLMEAESGRIIWEQNAGEPLPMASTTKIMTALITLSQPDLEEEFTVDADAIRVEGTSMGLRRGDRVSLYALAVGMLTVSGNDAANAAAVRIAGSQAAFARMMNAKADELGMKNTRFVTPSGLDADGHASTAYDMALLGAAALRNERFAAICGARSTAVSYGDPAYIRVLSNSNRLLRTYEGCLGIKTGYTTKAGRCLVTAVERDGVRLICVTLNDADDWNDHRKLYDYGFSAVHRTRAAPEEGDWRVEVTGTGQQVQLIPSGEVTVSVLDGESGQITQQAVLPEFVFAPVTQGQPVGEIQYFYNGRKVAAQPLVAAYDVLEPAPKNFWQKLLDFFGLSAKS